MIGRCLERVRFADEVVVVVDDRTTDTTAETASLFGAEVVLARFESFAQFKNVGLDHASGDWLFVVDADERVTGGLTHEILSTIADTGYDAFRVPIENWFYGRRFRDSGYREAPFRLFRRGHHFSGDIHESIVLPPGAHVGNLRESLVHFSHRSIVQNLEKTARYAEVQAAQMLRDGHPRVTRRVLVSVFTKRLIRHLVLGRGYREGTEGFIESLYQPLSHFAVYARLWELQQRPTIEERYAAAEEERR